MSTPRLDTVVRSCFVFSLFSLAPIVVRAQLDNTLSTPVPGSGHAYISDLSETVDPKTGGVSIRVVAPTPAERGMNLPTYVYIYDSNGQQTLSPNWSYSGANQSEYVSSIELGAPWTVGGGPNSVSDQSTSIDPLVGTGLPAPCTYWDDYVYTDPAGNRHALPGLQATSNSLALGCAGLGISASPRGSIAGDSAYQGVATGDGTSVVVFDNHGNIVGSSPGSGEVTEDTNGNFINGTGRPYSTSPALASASFPGPLGGPYTSVSIPGLAKPYTFSASISARGSTSPFPFNLSPRAGQPSSCPTTFSGTEGGYSGSATLSLPNSQQYSFTMDSTFGLLNHITYPTGATVDYTWSISTQSQRLSAYLPASTPSAPCYYTYDWPAIQSRIVTVNGVKTKEEDYSYTTLWGQGVGVPWTQKTTTVITKDLVSTGTPSYKVVYTYTQPVTGDVDTIATYDFSGSLLTTVTKVWDTTGNYLVAQCTKYNTNGPTSGVFYQYQGNVVSDEAEYDFGVVGASCQRPTTGSPTRETITAYHAFAPTPLSIGTNRIVDRPDSVKTYGSGVLLAETDYTYDEYVTYPLVPVSPAAIAHDEANYSATSTTARGNATTKTVKCFLPSGTACTNSVTHAIYDETGQVVETIDGNKNPTYYSYLDAYTTDNGSPAGQTNTYLTKVTRPAVNGVKHITTYTYGFNDGKLRSSLDENLQTTTYCYWVGGCYGKTFDPWLRLTGTSQADGGGSTTTYSDSGPALSVTTSTSASPDPSITAQTVMDELGHVVHTKLTSDSSGTDSVDTTYNGLGQVQSVSNAYRSTGDSTYGITSYTYDALGRKVLQRQPDGNSLQWCYNGTASAGQTNCLTNKSSRTTGAWVDIVDEAGNPRQQVSDALGRLTAVMEPAPNTKTPALETDYSYDALDNLLSVNQNGVSGDTPRKRSFTYDSLSRLLCASNPENSQNTCPTSAVPPRVTSYVYDPNGNLSSKTDPRGITTNYSYDALNRLLSKTYTNDTTGTASSCYLYDGASTTNSVGRLTSQWTQTASLGACGTTLPSTGYLTLRSIVAYDKMGRLKNEQQSTPASQVSGKIYAPAYTYDLAGNLLTSTDGSTPSPTTPGATLTFTNTFDDAGRLSTVKSNWSDTTSHPGTLFSAQAGTTTHCPNSASTPYTAFGALMNATYGIGSAANVYTLNRSFDTRLRTTCEIDKGSGLVP